MCQHIWLKCGTCGTVFRGPAYVPGSGHQIRCRQWRNDPTGESHNCAPPKNSKSTPIPAEPYYHTECNKDQRNPRKRAPPPPLLDKSKMMDQEQHDAAVERKRFLRQQQNDDALDREEQLKLGREGDAGKRAQIRADSERERSRRQGLREQQAEKRQRGQAAEPEEPRITLPGTAYTRTRTDAERAEQESAERGSQRRRREDSDDPGEQARKRRDDKDRDQRRKDRDMWK